MSDIEDSEAWVEGVKIEAKTYSKCSKRAPERSYNSGTWTSSENDKYLGFLNQHPTLFEEDNRRSNKVFKLMAAVITTRSALQCRSHYQKMAGK